MGEVRIRIGETAFRMQCGDGLEKRVEYLVGKLGARIETMRQEMPAASEIRIISMAAFSLCDELDEVKNELDKLKAEAKAMRSLCVDPERIGALQALSNRVSSLIRRVEKKGIET